MDRQTSGDGCKKIAKTSSNPGSTGKSVIKKWKVFGAMRPLPEFSQPCKLDSRVRRKLVREASERLMATLRESRDFIAKSGHCVHDDIITSARQIWLVWEGCKEKSCLTHLEDSEAKWKKVLLSDEAKIKLFEAKIKLFGLNGKWYVWLKPCTAPHPKNTLLAVKHDGGASCSGGVSQQQGLEHLQGCNFGWNMSGDLISPDYGGNMIIGGVVLAGFHLLVGLQHPPPCNLHP